jgi:hypothetical protein
LALNRAVKVSTARECSSLALGLVDLLTAPETPQATNNNPGDGHNTATSATREATPGLLCAGCCPASGEGAGMSTRQRAVQAAHTHTHTHTTGGGACWAPSPVRPSARPCCVITSPCGQCQANHGTWAALAPLLPLTQLHGHGEVVGCLLPVTPRQQRLPKPHVVRRHKGCQHDALLQAELGLTEPPSSEVQRRQLTPRFNIPAKGLQVPGAGGA